MIPMNKNFKTVTRVFVFSLLISSICLAENFKVTQVYDGDTINVVKDGKEIKVRLAGIDAPETSKKIQPKQPFSGLAARFLAELVLNQKVEIKTYGIDRYDNTLGVVYIDGRNINLKMVRVGLAEVLKGDLPKDFNLKPYQWEEADAKKNGRGIWALGDKYVRPREWRKMQRQ